MKTSSIKISLFAALTALCATAVPEAKAASFKLETIVPGYTGYVLVKPELRSALGGRVRWNSSLRCYETDRVKRGEKIRLTISPSTAGERCQNLALAGVSSSNGFFSFSLVTLPYVENRFSVSTNPSFDNVHVTVATSTGVYQTRLPIGSRP